MSVSANKRRFVVSRARPIGPAGMFFAVPPPGR
jgi:hypothetical protein